MKKSHLGNNLKNPLIQLRLHHIQTNTIRKYFTWYPPVSTSNIVQMLVNFQSPRKDFKKKNEGKCRGILTTKANVNERRPDGTTALFHTSLHHIEQKTDCTNVYLYAC